MQEGAVLEMRGISKFFPGVKALQNVDFTLRKGEIHALMGENGAGKSTLIKVLTGVYEKDAGEIHIAGHDGPVSIRRPQDAQRCGISTVYQEITLCPNLTVAENMYIARTPGSFTSWKKMNSGAKKLLDDLGIPAEPNRQLGDYSIAVQQMVAIARAVCCGPELLLLDEAFKGLDEQCRRATAAYIRRHTAGASVLCVTHDPEEATLLGGRCIDLAALQRRD